MTELELLGRVLRYQAHAVTTPDGLTVATQDWAAQERDDAGRGRDILFIHGYSQAGLCWMRQTSGPLARRYRMATFDLRGHGGSDKPTDPAHYRDPQLWAGEVAAVIETLGLVRPVLVAWSYAGRVALDYLSCFGSDGISGLVMVSGTSTMGPQVAGPATPALRRMAEARDFAESFAATRDFLARCVAEPVAAAERELMMAWNLAVPPWVRQAMVGRPADYDATLAALDVPVLAIHGDRDEVNLPAMSEHTRRICRHGRMLVYANVGHIPFWEAADRFDADLAAFVDALPAAPVRETVGP